jgi:hypothetical protein
MIDTQTAMVHITGIWKALGKNKADIVRLIESQPESALAAEVASSSKEASRDLTWP